MSKISYCDATWNVVSGCTRVSEGCEHCYAERLVGTRLAHLPRYAGLTQSVYPRVECPTEGHLRHMRAEASWTGQVRCHEDLLDEPLHWRKPRRVFVCSMSDLFHERVPFEFIEKVWRVMRVGDRQTFIVLTKRPARMLEFLKWYVNRGGDCLGFPHRNVWLGVSVENQAAADDRIPLLLECPAAVRCVSCEPLLGAVDLTHVQSPTDAYFDALKGFWWHHADGRVDHPRVNWVVIGGESGPGARRMDPEWATNLILQCQSAGVAVYMKQMGTVLAREWGLKSRAGSVPSEWPPEFQVREVPE